MDTVAAGSYFLMKHYILVMSEDTMKMSRCAAIIKTRQRGPGAACPPRGTRVKGEDDGLGSTTTEQF